MKFVFTTCTLLSISTIVIATTSKSYATNGNKINGTTIKLADTEWKSYTQYLSEENADKDFSFNIEIPDDFLGVFISVAQYNVPSEYSQGENNVTKICSLYRMQFLYPNGAVRPLCNGSEIRNSYDALNPGIILDFPGSGVIQVKVSIVSKLKHYYSRMGVGMENYAKGPLIGPTGRQIPRSSIGSITFTAYAECGSSELSNDTEVFVLNPVRPTGLSLKSCSVFSSNQCISSRLFCDGDINCGLSLMDILFWDKNETMSYDESDKRCLNSRLWKQKEEYRYRKPWESNYNYPSYGSPSSGSSSGNLYPGSSLSGSSKTYTTSSGSGTSYKTYFFIPVGLIVSLILCIVGALGRKRNRTPPRDPGSGNTQQGLLYQPQQRQS